MPKCGTYGGYQAHLKRCEAVCEPCRLARNAYAVKRRQQSPAAKEKNRLQVGAQNRALSRLAKAYPATYRRLLNEERSALREAGGA